MLQNDREKALGGGGVCDRELILDRLSASKGGAVNSDPLYVKTVPDGGLWEAFIARLMELRGDVADVSLLDDFAGTAVYDDDLPAEIKSVLGDQATDVWSARIGVTCAEFAVAETGSLVLSAKQGRARLNSLVPPIHAVLVEPSKTVPSLEAAFEIMPPESSAIISGPSRTADIEGVMVMGVHGPKKLWVVPIGRFEPD